VDQLIRAMPEIIKRLGRAYLIVLGDGPELENLQNLAQSLKLAEQIKFLDRVPHEKVLEYFSHADVFVLNTNYEGLSHTLLEAIKAGAPVIATDVGGNPEVITDGQNGLLVNYNNQKQLIEAIFRLLTDRPLAQKLTEAATVKLKDFSWRQTVDQTVDLLKKMQ
jgi:glycosyltransferase involved in cell wall biosynthesis